MPRTKTRTKRSAFTMRDPMIDLVEAAFDRDDLARLCVMPERDFAEAYDMETWTVDQRTPNDFFAFRDNGSRVLAVAHLDTVADASARTARYLDTSGGPVVYSRALDDRLGAYIILELLPKLGITYDVLLTVGEEDGESTAAFFEATKEYDWIIEFDRGGTDVVLYQYEDDYMIDLVEASGARVGEGIFSDISYMEHLGVKAINWGVGYRDYHGPRAHAYLDDTMMMVAQYLQFHHDNAGTPMPHEYVEPEPWWRTYGDHLDDYWTGDDMREPVEERECDRIFGPHDHDDDDCADVIASL